VRTVFVAAGRLERWVTGFAERHPGTTAVAGPDQVRLSAPDGSNAVLHPVFGPLPARTLRPVIEPAGSRLDPTPEALAASLAANAGSVLVLRALLIRRGGYACAVVTGDEVTSSKVGSRYVQGRTAAGGWSQQRFARRRNGQVHALLGAVTEVAVRVLLPAAATDVLLTGGDRQLIDRVLADPRLAGLARLRRGHHLEIGDPRSDLVKELPERARAIEIDLDER
jgi:Actinobacteria/chloroflexi VLRF1 release factor